MGGSVHSWWVRFDCIHSHQFWPPAHAEGSCDCSTASVCRCPHRWGWILETTDKQADVSENSCVVLLWSLVMQPELTWPDVTQTYHPDVGACWSWVDFWPVPPRPPSHSYKETSWQNTRRGFIFSAVSGLQYHFYSISDLSSVYVFVLTIPSEWSASFHWWCRAHTPCRAPTGLCLCSRCWRTGSCGTGSPDRPSEPVYWTDSGFTDDRVQQEGLCTSLPCTDCCVGYESYQVLGVRNLNWLWGFSSTHHTSAKGAVPVSNESVGHHEGDGVRVWPPNRLHCNGNMSQRHLVVTYTDLKRHQDRLLGITSLLSIIQNLPILRYILFEKKQVSINGALCNNLTCNNHNYRL